MSLEIKVPTVGESISEVTLVKWINRMGIGWKGMKLSPN
jgi:hypothetical protein